jgi:hypothetical protein
MQIQFYPEELNYVNAKLDDAHPVVDKSFLLSFLDTCLRADGNNYEVLRPALYFFMAKYPADEKRLAAETEDYGH